MTGPHSPSAGSRAGLMAPPLTTLPAGLEVELDANVHRSRDGRLMLGGSPPRLLRLSRSAARILQPGRFTVADAGTAALARRLVDIGVAHPRPPAQPVRDVTIVIPVRDRADLLDQLLTTLGADPQTSAVPVLVVELGRSALRWANRLLVVNGHGGNLPSLTGAIAMRRREGRDAAWWPCLPRGAAWLSHRSGWVGCRRAH